MLGMQEELFSLADKVAHLAPVAWERSRNLLEARLLRQGRSELQAERGTKNRRLPAAELTTAGGLEIAAPCWDLADDQSSRRALIQLRVPPYNLGTEKDGV